MQNNYFFSFYDAFFKDSFRFLKPEFCLLNKHFFAQGDSNTKHLKIKPSVLQNQLMQLLKRFPNLLSLNLSINRNIVNLMELPNLTPKLKNLNLTACYSILDFSFISQLTSLDTITLNCNKQILDTERKFSFLYNLKISNLSLRGINYAFQNLQSIDLEDELKHFNSLKHLDVGFSNIGNSLHLLCIPSQIESLNIDYCFNILFDSSYLYFSHMSHLKNLKSLSLQACKLREIKYLGSLINLKYLDLSFPTKDFDGSISNLSSISTLTNLESLILMGCENIEDLNPLVNLQKLKYLDLRNCNKIKDFSPLLQLSLEHLELPNGDILKGDEIRNNLQCGLSY